MRASAVDRVAWNISRRKRSYPDEIPPEDMPITFRAMSPERDYVIVTWGKLSDLEELRKEHPDFSIVWYPTWFELKLPSEEVCERALLKGHILAILRGICAACGIVFALFTITVISLRFFLGL
jgi:hypothetical protein